MIETVSLFSSLGAELVQNCPGSAIGGGLLVTASEVLVI